MNDYLAVYAVLFGYLAIVWALTAITVRVWPERMWLARWFG